MTEKKRSFCILLTLMFKSIIPEALNCGRDYPGVPESWFDGRIEMDKRKNGSDYVRNANDLDYCSKYFENNAKCEELLRKFANKQADDPTNKGSLKGIEDGDKDVIMQLAYDVQSNPVVASIDQLEPLRRTMIGVDGDTDDESTVAMNESPALAVLTDTWNITQDFVRNCFAHIGTLSDKDDPYKELMADNLEGLNVNLLTSHHLLPRYGALNKEHGIQSNHFNFVIRFATNEGHNSQY